MRSCLGMAKGYPSTRSCQLLPPDPFLAALMRSSSGSREAAWLLLSLEGGAAGLTGREAIADRDGSPARPGVGEGRG